MKTYTKREFIRLAGLGTLGGVLFGCYKKEESLTMVNAQSKKNAPKFNPPDALPQQEDATSILHPSEEDVIFLSREDAAYAQFKQGYNKRIHKSPKIIARCKTEKGVEMALKKAIELDLKVAIRSGGHSFEGFSNINDGLLLDLRLLNQIIPQEKNEFIIQSGATLAEIYDFLLPRKRLLPAGSCATVGVGGLTLGGGYGFFSRKYGLTCDHVEDFTMVTATGKTVQARDNPDLFWACKGGGNGNFGVITSFRFRTHAAPKGFSSFRFKFRNLNSARFMRIKNLWFPIAAALPRDAFSAFVLNGKTLTILFTCYEQSVAAMEEQFAALFAREGEYNKWPHQPLAKALRRYYGLQAPIYFKNASAGFISSESELAGSWESLFEKVQQYKGIIFQWNSMGGAIADFTKNSAYTHREALFLGELQAYWEEPHQEEKLRTGFAQMQTLMHKAGIRKHYRNYPDLDFENANAMYFGEELTRLEAVKQKWDPDNRFRYEQGLV